MLLKEGEGGGGLQAGPYCYGSSQRCFPKCSKNVHISNMSLIRNTY